MKRITIFTHGLSRGDPGPAAIGVQMVNSKGKVRQEISEAIGNASGPYAEYFAVVRAFQAAEKLFGKKTKEMQFELKLDSELVKKQLNGESQIKDISLIGHFIEIHNMQVANFPNLTFTQVRLESNQEAVRLVNEALDS